ncbi:hypothetical protein ACFE04_018135 [Oxalis oulophora]
MLLKASPAFSLLVKTQITTSLINGGRNNNKNNNAPLFFSFSKKPLVRGASGSKSLAGVVFDPFVEVQKELHDLVHMSSNVSLARHKYADECEAALNEQINVEYNVSYVYHALYAYFDRDNVALKGLAKFFKESSLEEREHAEKLMEYQNKRGGRVKLQSIMTTVSEFDNADKGDALYAMELALSLEKLVNEKLLNLHSVVSRNNDPQLTDFIESEYLSEQVEAIKKISEYVTQLRMLGKGHGVWHFDQMLLNGAIITPSDHVNGESGQQTNTGGSEDSNEDSKVRGEELDDVVHVPEDNREKVTVARNGRLDDLVQTALSCSKKRKSAIKKEKKVKVLKSSNDKFFTKSEQRAEELHSTSNETSQLVPESCTFSVLDAFKVVNSMEGVPKMSELKFFALNLILDKEKRVLFMALDPDERLWWLKSFFEESKK